jgi:hypothetical protein
VRDSEYRRFIQKHPEAGVTGPKVILVVLLLGVLAFAGFKIGGAFLDVNGFKADLEAKVDDLFFGCIASDCEEKFFDQLQEIIDLQGRDVELYWPEIDYAYTDNEVIIPGYKVIDFLVYQYRWEFIHEIQIFH